MKTRPRALRKAAILMASLDQATADDLFAQMSVEQADAVRDAMDELGSMAPGEQQAVIEEFFRIGPLVPEQTPPGIELDGPAARQIAQRSSSPDVEFAWSQQASAAQRGRPFGSLEQASTDELARYLEREHPQTAAIVISHLTSQRAAAVLAELPANLQGEVTLRLVHLDETDPEILREIERGMEPWLHDLSRASHRRAAGLETVRGILSAADDHAKQQILRNLAERDRRLAGKLGGGPQQFARFVELTHCDNATWQELLRTAPGATVRLAFSTANAALVDRALDLLPPEESIALERALAQPGPLRLIDVERAQRELVALANSIAGRGSAAHNETKRFSLAV